MELVTLSTQWVHLLLILADFDGREINSLRLPSAPRPNGATGVLLGLDGQRKSCLVQEDLHVT